MTPSLGSVLSNRTKQKIIPATIVDVLNGRCSVRLSGRGTKLTNLSFLGASPAKGDQVVVDYRNSSTPIVVTSASSVPAPAATIIPDCSLPTPDITPVDPNPYPYSPVVPYSYPNSYVSPAANSFFDKPIGWVITNPIVRCYFGLELPVDIVISKINVACADGKIIFNVEDRESILVSGINVMEEDFTIDSASDFITSFSHANVPSGHWLCLDISGIVGSPSQIVVSITV